MTSHNLPHTMLFVKNKCNNFFKLNFLQLHIIKSKSVADKKGFTLVELLVSVAIIGVITSVVVFNQQDFTDQVALSNTMSEISLQIREAQTYGVSVREFNTGTQEFNLGYGVSFNINNTPGLSNSSYIYFADRPSTSNNGTFDTPGSCLPGPSSECLSRVYLTRGNTITQLCALLSDNTCPTVARLDISFFRPYPNARIIFFNNAGTIVPFPTAQAGKIEITTPSGKVQNIVVYTTGQIAIE